MITRRLIAMVAVLLGVMWSQDTLAFYNSSTGRWLNRDPIEEKGGINLYAFAEGDPIKKIDALGLLTSIDNAIRTCLTLPSIAARIQCLDQLMQTISGNSANETAIKIAKCEAIHGAYKALNCKGCATCTTQAEAVKNGICLKAEIAGRLLYLKWKCDYILPGSIARGSAKAEKGHQEQVLGKTVALGKCIAAAKTLP